MHYNGQGLEAEVGMVAGNQMKSFMMMMAITGFLSNVAFLKYGCERLPSLNLKKSEKHLIHELTQRAFFPSDY